MKSSKDIGLVALIEKFELNVPLPMVRSKITTGVRRTEVKEDEIIETYLSSYDVETDYGQIKFALRYEPLDILIYKKLFEKLDRNWFEGHIKSEPTGKYARKLWYLYENFTGEKLDLEDCPRTGYVDLADDNLQIPVSGKKSRRHYINDNLLGNNQYCPLIRRTEKIEKLLEDNLQEKIGQVVKRVDPLILARAVHFLYTKETKSSFAIEGERVGKKRGERFVAALRESTKFDVYSKEDFIKLQNLIVDPRYAESDWRDSQNFIGQTTSDYREQIYYACPKPDDLDSLIDGWTGFIKNCEENKEVSAIALAAAASFGFVFIHPFEDGNGRIHRFLIHHFLSSAGLTQPNILFPVSAVMLRKRYEYEKVLESFSSSIMKFIDYSLNQKGYMTVNNATVDFYKFWDATKFVEYLYDCVNETIEVDLEEEIGFLQKFDQALEEVSEIVEMPDRKASLLVRMIMQNKGKLSNRKRDKFAELTDEEIIKIEKALKNLT